MSTAPPDAPPPPAGSIRCARCGADVPRGQDWCLECGLAARTRVAPTPPWRVPLVAAAVISVLALVALGLAFVDLTEDPKPAPAQTAPAAAPATQPPPAATAAPPTPTQPPATTATTPAATAPQTTAPQTTATTGSGGAQAP